jgi:predicted nucleotidyltransferase
MRLKEREKNLIIAIFKNTFIHGALYLFGSRVDDTAKGGDIDLYIVPDDFNKLTEKKVDFLVRLKKIIGEQKIDVVIDRRLNRTIDRVAREQGVLLCQN